MAKNKRFRKIYVEISNICNLKCSFCPGTKREKRIMQPAELAALLPKLRPYSDYLYFHLMGEPLFHPRLADCLLLAAKEGFRVILTTNGTLLSQNPWLADADGLHKVNISLHAFEANELAVPFRQYLDDCLAFGKNAVGKKLVSFRLWNNGGQDGLNGEILSALHAAFPGEWVKDRRGTRLTDGVYLEQGDKFDWPDLNCAEESASVFCYALRDQLGVLADGTVVPCCLDHEGDIPLGNLFRQDLAEILGSPRAKALYDGFSRRKATEELCRKCGYARRFG